MIYKATGPWGARCLASRLRAERTPTSPSHLDRRALNDADANCDKEFRNLSDSETLDLGMMIGQPGLRSGV